MPFSYFDGVDEVYLIWAKVEGYGLYLQSLKTFVQSSHNFVDTNPAFL
jgi:hypothetical protein